MLKNIPIIVLCGGKGSRMNNLSKTLPKALIPINKKPLIQIKLEKYSKQGFKKFIICLGYKGIMIKKFLKGTQFKSLDLKFVNSGENASMMKGINDCKKYIKNIFILTYGDTISNINFSNLLKVHQKNKKNLTIVVSKFHNPYGVVKFKDNNDISSFDEKPISYNYIGYSIINVSSLSLIPKKILEMPDSYGLITFFKLMISLNDAKSYIYDGLQLTFNTQADINNNNFISI